jgi:glycosyltransferase involved in cell wall biosynthesis
MTNSNGQMTLVDIKMTKTVSGQLPLNVCLLSQWRFDDLSRMPGKPISEARKLSKEVGKIVFVCYNEQNQYLSRRITGNLFVYTMPLTMSYSLYHSLINLPRNLVTAGIFLAKIIKMYDIDFVRADNIILGGIPILIANRLLKTTFAIWLAGSEETVIGIRYGKKGFAGLIKSIFTFIKRIVLNRARFVLSVSDELKRSESSETKTPIITTPNYVNLDEFKPSNNVENANQLRLLYVGRLETEKGINYLLDAFRMIDSSFNITLQFAGFGTLQGMVEGSALKNSSIQYLGMFSHEEMPSVYRNADVLILPSLTEGMPAVILEALSCGLPVIASRVGQVPMVIRDGIEGILVNPGVAGDILNAFVDLAQDTEKLVRMKNAARQRAIDISGNYIEFHRTLYSKFLLEKADASN